MSRRPHVLTAALVVAAAALAGCGSGSSTTAGSAAPTGSAAAAGSTATTQAAAPSSSAAAAASGGDFCGTVRKNVKIVTGQGMSSLLAGGTPAAWKAYLAAAARANQDLVDAAPADIRPTLQTLQKDSDSVGTLMAAAGYDASKVRSSELIKAVTSPEHTAATTKFVGYVKTSCGIDLTKLGA